MPPIELSDTGNTLASRRWILKALGTAAAAGITGCLGSISGDTGDSETSSPQRGGTPTRDTPNGGTTDRTLTTKTSTTQRTTRSTETSTDRSTPTESATPSETTTDTDTPPPDSDLDGLTDEQERELGTDPEDYNTDDDLQNDVDEVRGEHRSDPTRLTFDVYWGSEEHVTGLLEDEANREWLRGVLRDWGFEEVNFYDIGEIDIENPGSWEEFTQYRDRIPGDYRKKPLLMLQLEPESTEYPHFADDDDNIAVMTDYNMDQRNERAVIMEEITGTASSTELRLGEMPSQEAIDAFMSEYTSSQSQWNTASG